MSTGHGSDIAHGLLSSGWIGIGLNMEAVSGRIAPKRGLSRAQDIQRIRCNGPYVLCVIGTRVDDRAALGREPMH